MKENGLLVERKIYKAKRRPTRSKPKAEKPLEFWGIDMTKFMIEGLGWAYLVIVLDWFTKEIVGFDISLRSRSEDWLRALEMGLNKKFPEGVRGKGLRLISDNGSQPTSRAFMREMVNLGIEQIFTFPPAVGQVMTILKEMQIQSACLSPPACGQGRAGTLKWAKICPPWRGSLQSLGVR